MADGTGMRAWWALIAGDGDGPEVAAISAYLLTRMILAGQIEPGARACIGALPTKDIEHVTAELGIASCSAHQIEQSLFESVLGKNFAGLPSAIRKIHDSRIYKRFEGRSTVTRRRGMVVNLTGKVVGFPESGREIPTIVAIQRDGVTEIRICQFGSARFGSLLSPTQGKRGGLLSFDIDLEARDSCLYYPVARGRIGPMPLPRFLTPGSDTVEHQGPEDGRFCFSVKIALPFFDHLVSYEGWLVEDIPHLSLS
jgi:Domain of unknown function (DUF4166)